MNTVLSPEQVADRFEQLVKVSDRFESELRQIQARSVPASEATVRRLSDLLAVLRPASLARRELAEVDTDLLAAGVSAWLARPGSAPDDLRHARRLEVLDGGRT